MSTPWAFLKSEDALLAEAYAAGVAAAGKGPARLFQIWRDLRYIFKLRPGQRYMYMASRVRTRFIEGVKAVDITKFLVEGEGNGRLE